MIVTESRIEKRMEEIKMENQYADEFYEDWTEEDCTDLVTAQENYFENPNKETYTELQVQSKKYEAQVAALQSSIGLIQAIDNFDARRTELKKLKENNNADLEKARMTLLAHRQKYEACKGRIESLQKQTDACLNQLNRLDASNLDDKQTIVFDRLLSQMTQHNLVFIKLMDSIFS